MVENIHAFSVYTGNEKNWEYGMTLRDWFAGQVLANNFCSGDQENIAEYAYRVADAMLKEREKK